MNQVAQITAKYQDKLGRANERTSFMHGAIAAQAADELAQISDSVYINAGDYAFVWRVGQVLGDARFFAAVSHQNAEVYMFQPEKLES